MPVHCMACAGRPPLAWPLCCRGQPCDQCPERARQRARAHACSVIECQRSHSGACHVRVDSMFAASLALRLQCGLRARATICTRGARVCRELGRHPHGRRGARRRPHPSSPDSIGDVQRQFSIVGMWPVQHPPAALGDHGRRELCVVGVMCAAPESRRARRALVCGELCVACPCGLPLVTTVA